MSPGGARPTTGTTGRAFIAAGDWYGSNDSMFVLHCPACGQAVGRGYDHGDQECTSQQEDDQ